MLSMMVRRIKFILIVTSLVLESCNSQSNFDLLKFPLDTKVEDLSLNDIEVKKGSYYLGMDYKTYKIYNSKFLRIGNLDVAGRIYPNKNYERNVVNFCFSKKDSIITSLEINIYTEELDPEIMNRLSKKLGEPNFLGFDSQKDKEESKPDTYVWEDLKEKKTFFLHRTILSSEGKKKFKSLRLFIVNHSDRVMYNQILDFGDFQYYSDYIEERERKGDLNYTYQQFVKDETKGGRAQYYIHYSE